MSPRYPDVTVMLVGEDGNKVAAEPPPAFGQMPDQQLKEYTRSNFGPVADANGCMRRSTAPRNPTRQPLVQRNIVVVCGTILLLFPARSILARSFYNLIKIKMRGPSVG
jgi:hypothetical protein